VGYLFLRWRGTTIEVIGGEKRLEAYKGPGQEPFVFKSDQQAVPEREQMPAIGHPRSFEACQGWIARRKNYFENRRRVFPSESRIEKPLSTQIGELEGQCERIARFMQGIRQGENLWFPPLKAELRSMIAWNEKRSRNYNPALLRLANEKSLPLPVYCFSEFEEDMPPILDGLEFLYTGNEHAAMLNLTEGLALVDLQEWLTRPIVIVMRAGKPEKNSILQCLLSSSNTTSSAHFDETIPDYVQGMQEAKFFGIPHEDKVLMNLSECALPWAGMC
jgi:hypothetical protein